MVLSQLTIFDVGNTSLKKNSVRGNCDSRNQELVVMTTRPTVLRKFANVVCSPRCGKSVGRSTKVRDLLLASRLSVARPPTPTILNKETTD